MHPDRDPYAPPPRYKNRSGAMVRFVILGALIAAGAWGYMQFAQQPQTAALVPAAEEQALADSSMDAGYQVEPQTQDAVPPAAPSATPAPRSAPAAPSEPVPAPTTTTEQPPA
jgi:hypothetical protein